MKKRFVVITDRGFWGAGDTLFQATREAKGIKDCTAWIYTAFVPEGGSISISDSGGFRATKDVLYSEMKTKNGKIVLE